MMDINSITEEDLNKYKVIIGNAIKYEVSILALKHFMEFDEIFGNTPYEVLRVPYDEVPLYIEGQSISSLLARWRLSIGK